MSARTADYDYGLPSSAIAQEPIEPRDAARLLVALDHRAPVDRHVRDLPGLLAPGDVVVVNDTRVLPARLHLRKASGGAAEVLLVRPVGGDVWEALLRPARRLPAGTVLFSDGEPVVAVLGGGRVRVLRDPWPYGSLPLPPYIHAPLADPSRYQTVYAAHPGSVAAPTAGLHLTPSVLDACPQVVSLQLDVGLGTFQPITSEDPAAHHMHAERYCIPPKTWEMVQSASRVVAVGTTVVRALESAAVTGSLSGDTSLYIRAGFQFQVVDVLMTNFHLPRSTLLLLVEAFVGPRWRSLYATALARGYRFLSFGDAMLVRRAA